MNPNEARLTEGELTDLWRNVRGTTIADIAEAQLRKALTWEIERIRTLQGRIPKDYPTHPAWLEVGIIATELEDGLKAAGLQPWPEKKP